MLFLKAIQFYFSFLSLYWIFRSRQMTTIMHWKHAIRIQRDQLNDAKTFRYNWPETELTPFTLISIRISTRLIWVLLKQEFLYVQFVKWSCGVIIRCFGDVANNFLKSIRFKVQKSIYIDTRDIACECTHRY